VLLVFQIRRIHHLQRGNFKTGQSQSSLHRAGTFEGGRKFDVRIALAEILQRTSLKYQHSQHLLQRRKLLPDRSLNSSSQQRKSRALHFTIEAEKSAGYHRRIRPLCIRCLLNRNVYLVGFEIRPYVKDIQEKRENKFSFAYRRNQQD
jgi:hypothetical protein